VIVVVIIFPALAVIDLTHSEVVPAAESFGYSCYVQRGTESGSRYSSRLFTSGRRWFQKSRSAPFKTVVEAALFRASSASCCPYAKGGGPELVRERTLWPANTATASVGISRESFSYHPPSSAAAIQIRREGLGDVNNTFDVLCLLRTPSGCLGSFNR
jgi:hypothetical protein